MLFACIHDNIYNYNTFINKTFVCIFYAFSLKQSKEKNYGLKVYREYTKVTRRFKEAELVLKNAKIINVFTNEIITGDIAIEDGMIVGIGNYEG